jgi:hypothetical protein
MAKYRNPRLIRIVYRLCSAGWALVGLAALLLSVSGCGIESTTAPPVSATATVSAPGPADRTPVSTAVAPGPTDSTPTVPGPPALGTLYDYAPDYSWLAGQIREEAGCWIVTYVPPESDRAADQYNNQLALLPGRWDQALLTSGAWVLVYGQPASGIDPAPDCSAHGYRVISLQLQTANRADPPPPAP